MFGTNPFFIRHEYGVSLSKNFISSSYERTIFNYKYNNKHECHEVGVYFILLPMVKFV